MKSTTLCAVALMCCSLAVALPYLDDAQLSDGNIQRLREFLEARKLQNRPINKWPAASHKSAPRPVQPIANPLQTEPEREFVDDQQDSYGFDQLQQREVEQASEPDDSQDQENQLEERNEGNSVNEDQEQDQYNEESVDERSLYVNGDEDEDDINMQERALPSDIKTLFNAKVVKSERYQYAQGRWNQAGVVVTLTEGNRLLVLCRATRQYQGPKPTAPVILDARTMTDKWKLTETKNVEKSTLRDFINVCGKSPSPFESADAMFALS